MATPQHLYAYRQLYRAALRAVHHSSPAKYQVRDAMRSAFRNEAPEAFSQQKVGNTLKFLERAELYAGMEHKILQNLLHVRYWRIQGKRENRLFVAAAPVLNKVLTMTGSTSKQTWPRLLGRILGLNSMPR